MRGAITGDGGGRDIAETDQEAKPRPWHKGKRELTNAKGYAACHEAHGNPTEHAGPRVEGPDANRQTDELGQRKDSKREQQPAEEADAEDDEQRSKDNHGGALREIKV